MKDCHCWVKPPCRPLVGGSRLSEVLRLLLEYGKNCTGRVACLELGGKWVCNKITLGAFLVFFEGIIEDQLEVSGRWLGGGMIW
jgi:hypothetical protein